MGRVEGLQDAVDDVIGPMVNRPVIVRIIRTSPNKLNFVDIELADWWRKHAFRELAQFWLLGSGQAAEEVINHLGDEVMKVFRV